MITRLEISNYRSCLNCSFDLQPHLSVLIGPNGSGKTNILNALLLLRKLTEERPRYHQYEETSADLSTLKASFNVGGKKAMLTALIQTYTDESNDDEILSSRQKWYMKPFTGSARRLTIPLHIVKEMGKDLHFLGGVRSFHSKYRYRRHGYYLESDQMAKPAMKPLRKVAEFVSQMRYYSASQFTNPSKCPVSFEIEEEGERSRGVGLGGHVKFLFDLYNDYKANTSGYQQFFEIIGPNGIALINGIKFQEMVTSSVDYSVRSGGRVRERKRNKILIIPQFTIGKHELSPNQLSEGTFKTITLLFYLVTESSHILLIEEPEVCVHHGLLASIVDLIKEHSRDKQVILSTHSDFVLDHVDPDNVYKVLCTPENGTKVVHIPKSMSKKELTALRKYLDTEGNLGEYWKHGALES